MAGPKAPKDPEARGKSFYIMRNKQVEGSPQPDGSGIHTIYLNNERLVSFAKIAGGIQDEKILALLRDAEGFRTLVSAIGVSVESDAPTERAEFIFRMYGRLEGIEGTVCRMPVRMDGMEAIVKLSDISWQEADAVPGQIAFRFAEAGRLAVASVRLYLKEGYDVPDPKEEEPVDFDSPLYRQMLEKSLMQTGNNRRLKKVLEKARRGEDVTVAFIGGSITQGAWAIPIHKNCYPYKAFEGFCALTGRGTEENVSYVKAGVGGTSSELGMVRYEKEVLRGGQGKPDLCVVEFAVNDEGDETRGVSYDCLVRRILLEENAPAVVLLFSVFTDDWNLQERLKKVGEAYHLPMVSIKDCVVEQFYKKPGQGRVLSKNQFFYDVYHPNTTGHKVMADCLVHLFETVDAAEPDGAEEDIAAIKAPYGDAFVDLKYLDRGCVGEGIRIDCGDFSGKDDNLQMVERDRSNVRTPEFPENWYHTAGDRPFVMDITCRSLVIVEKDSGSPMAGCAQIFVDGELMRTIDPHEVGWEHCNALICFQTDESRARHVEIAMKPGDEDRQFTILGFGYVE